MQRQSKEFSSLGSNKIVLLKLHPKAKTRGRDVAQRVIVFAVKGGCLRSSPQHPDQELDAAACHQHGDTGTAALCTAHHPVGLAEMTRL